MQTSKDNKLHGEECREYTNFRGHELDCQIFLRKENLFSLFLSHLPSTWHFKLHVTLSGFLIKKGNEFHIKLL